MECSHVKKEIIYHYRGPVERGGPRGGWFWRDGYSIQGKYGPSYPWLTKPEARQEAKSMGGRAVFMRDGKREDA